MKKNTSNTEYYASHWEIFQGNEVPTSKLSGAKHFFAPIEEFLQKKELVILDAGCGDGVHWHYLRSLPNQNHHYYGIDVAQSVISQLQNQTHNKMDRFQVMNLDSLKFPDSTFDIVFAFGVLGYCDNPEKAFDELYRVCKPGGLIGIFSPEITGIKKIFFETIRGLCKGMNLEGKRRIARMIIPLYGLLPSNSKMSQKNAIPLQIEEVIMTNIPPPQLQFLSNEKIKKQFHSHSVEVIDDNKIERTSIWGRKK
jgi:ubiquinone/menaquinone biosynthesis C-methylase UbiE